jgi:hypothetical protein
MPKCKAIEPSDMSIHPRFLKLDPDGKLLWSRQFDPSPEETLWDTYPVRRAELTITSTDELLVLGYASNREDLGSGGISSLRADCSEDGQETDCWYLMKLDAEGNRLWGGRFAGDAFPSSIAADHSGAILLSATNILNWTNGRRDNGSHVLAKLDAAAGYLWSTVLAPAMGRNRYFGLDWNWDRSLAVDAEDGIVYLGQGDDGMAPEGLLFSSDPKPWWITRLSKDGQRRWDAGVAVWHAGSPAAIAVDPALDSVVAGFFAGSVDFGTGPLQASGKRDGFVMKLDDAGAPLWSQRYGGSDEDILGDIASNAAGDLWISGWSGVTRALGPNSSGEEVTEAVRHAIFVSKLRR